MTKLLNNKLILIPMYFLSFSFTLTSHLKLNGNNLILSNKQWECQITALGLYSRTCYEVS